MQQPQLNSAPVKQCALFEIGFRPFFLLASVFSIILTALWMASFSFNWALPVSSVMPIAWHGHEMIFGYSLAIFAGFLLTAVRNWTGESSISGLALASLALCWLLARTLVLSGSPLLFQLAAMFDLLFLIGLIAAFIHPIIKVKQWRQLPLTGLLILLLAANTLYYLGVFHIVNLGISWGLFSGVYLIMALIFTIARRVMPFFIEKGVDEQFQVKNWSFIDRTTPLFLAALIIVDVFIKQPLLTALISTVLAVLHSIRLWGWHTKGIWQKPLLWVLFLAYGFLILGFILKALNYYHFYPSSIPLHAFTYGGIGLMSLAMMSRISLGHTGRNIQQPPSILKWVFRCLLLGAIIRVFVPIFVSGGYQHVIALSQSLWIIAFSLFLVNYLLIFIRPRVDGKPG